MSTAFTLPLVSAKPNTGQGSRTIVVGPDFSHGHFRSLKDAVDWAAERSSLTTPWTVHLREGLYDVGYDRLVLADGMTLRGEGMDRTIIYTTVVKPWPSSFQLPFQAKVPCGGGDFADPLVQGNASEGMILEDLTIDHQGPQTYLTIAGGAETPTDNFVDPSLAGYTVGFAPNAPLSDSNTNSDFIIRRCRIKAGGTGLIDRTSYTRTASEQPDGNTYWIALAQGDYPVRIEDSIIEGGWHGGMVYASHHLTAHNSIFRATLPTGKSLDATTGGNVARFAGFVMWHTPTILQARNCRFELLCDGSITEDADNVMGAFIQNDSAVKTRFEATNCVFFVHLGENADIDDSAVSGSAPLRIAGVGQGGGATNYVWLRDCTAYIRTPSGGLTACGFVGAYATRSFSSVPVVGLHANNCDLVDLGGTGTDQRGGYGNTHWVSFGWTTPEIRLTNCSGSLNNLNQAFDTEAQKTQFGAPRSLNDQSGFGTTSGGTLTVDFTDAGGFDYPSGFTEYWVLTEAAANTQVWITSKSNTGFIINTSSDTDVRWVVKR